MKEMKKAEVDSNPTLSFIFIVVTIFLLLCYYVYRYNTKNNQNEHVDDELIIIVKQAIGKSYSLLSADELKEIKDYKYDQKDSLFDVKAKSWATDNAKTENLCKLGSKLLAKYAADGEPEEYLKISTDIVLRISRIVHKLLEIKAENIENKPVVPKPKPVFNRYLFSTYIPKLMMEYEYIGDDDCIKEYVCRSIITKLIHSLNEPLEKLKNHSKMATFNLFLLLNNYLFDKTTNSNERKNKLLEELKNVYHIDYNLSDELKNGIYKDGSCIEFNNVVKFSYLFSLSNIYEDLYEYLGTECNFYDVVKPIIEKLTHPTIPYVTFGLYDNNGFRKGKNWHDIKGKLGITLMPYIGLGVFKTERFMFSVRVQRPDIRSYFKLSDTSTNDFALGWIQLRKMYLQGYDYLEPLTWETLCNEPGIITIKDENDPTILKIEKNLSILPKEKVNSLIGCLPNENVMFWINRYQIPEYYSDITITEMGIATDNGVEITYYTDKRSNHVLQIRVQDDDNVKNGLQIEPKTVNGFVNLNENTVTLKMLFPGTEEHYVKKNDGNDGMNFVYKDKLYTIKILEPNKKYVVYSDDSNAIISKKQIAFGGTTEFIDEMPLIIERKLKTLVRSTSGMFIPEQKE